MPESDATQPELAHIATDKIDAGTADQIRALDRDSTIDDLAESIRSIGLLSPITVARAGDRYRLVAGSRRLAAVRRLGWSTIPALILPEDRGETTPESLAENLARRDLDPIAQAEALRAAIIDQGHDVDRLAAALGRSRQWIDDRLALLEYPPDVQEAIRVHRLPLAVARELAAIRDGSQRRALLDTAIDLGVSARIARQWRELAEQPRQTPTADPATATPPTPTISSVVSQTQCTLCLEPHDLRVMSYPPICPDCLQRVRDAQRQAQS